MIYIYQLFLFLGFILIYPFHALRKKGGPSLRERLGICSYKIQKTKAKMVWIHAVSLGETKAVGPLARLIKESLGENVQFVVSSGTETGQNEAKKSLPFADFFIYLPLDFIWIMKKLVKAAKPDLVIVVETDIWLNFLSQCKSAGAKVVLVNGKMSEKSFVRYRSFPFWGLRVYSLFDQICIQSQHYHHRFAKLGIFQESLQITGNLKLDLLYPGQDDPQNRKSLLGLNSKDFVLVIGSTHHPEEKWLLEILDDLFLEFPRLKVLIAPRHPERFRQVEKLLAKGGLPYKKYSDKGAKTYKVMLIDALGVLKKCYQVADIAIVGGSFVEHVGGHNILEPSAYAVPVIFGPHMYSQPEFVDLCFSFGAGLSTPLDGLRAALHSLITNEEKRTILGNNGLRLIRESRGALQRTFEVITKNLH